jgi:hypothetical protein
MAELQELMNLRLAQENKDPNIRLSGAESGN